MCCDVLLMTVSYLTCTQFLSRGVNLFLRNYLVEGGMLYNDIRGLCIVYKRRDLSQIHALYTQ